MILGIGLDVVDHDRFQRLWERHRARFLQRVFRPEELDEGQAEKRSMTSWAVRFAAKEAVFKSLQYQGLMRWHEISVLRREGELVQVRLFADFAAHADQFGPWRIHVSLTHSRKTSAAVAILEKIAPPP